MEGGAIIIEHPVDGGDAQERRGMTKKYMADGVERVWKVWSVLRGCTGPESQRSNWFKGPSKRMCGLSYFTSHLIISRIFTLYNYFIVLFKIAFILIQPLAIRTTINVCVCEVQLFAVTTGRPLKFTHSRGRRKTTLAMLSTAWAPCCFRPGFPTLR